MPQPTPCRKLERPSVRVRMKSIGGIAQLVERLVRKDNNGKISYLDSLGLVSNNIAKILI